MLYIVKGEPPKSLIEKTIEMTKSDAWKNADSDDTQLLRSFFDNLDKQSVRESLVREQRGLCAYCMKRIEPNDRMHIEHFTPVKGHKDMVLNYQNMLGCCKGGGGRNEENRVLCCDAAKKEKSISLDPRNKEMMAKVRYSFKGRIYVYPEDSSLQHDIDRTLMLNGKLDPKGNMTSDTSTKIVAGRRFAYKEYEILMQQLDKKYGKNESKIQTAVKKKIAEIEGMEILPEYAGVMLYFLRRRVGGR